MMDFERYNTEKRTFSIHSYTSKTEAPLAVASFDKLMAGNPRTPVLDATRGGAGCGWPERILDLQTHI
jgi:hypothetical protein